MTRTSHLVMALSSGIFALASYRFFLLGLDASFIGLEAQIANRRALFLAHVLFGPLALLLGSVQFFPAFRARHLRLHRWVGRAYGLSVAIGGVAGLLIAPFSQGGLAGHLGLGLLSLAWLLATARAVYLAIRRDIKGHQRWMIRSFALTFSGVTLRVYLGGFMLVGYDYAAVAMILSWLCWLPNVVVAEWLIGKLQG